MFVRTFLYLKQTTGGLKKGYKQNAAGANKNPIKIEGLGAKFSHEHNLEALDPV